MKKADVKLGDRVVRRKHPADIMYVVEICKGDIVGVSHDPQCEPANSIGILCSKLYRYDPNRKMPKEK